MVIVEGEGAVFPVNAPTGMAATRCSQIISGGDVFSGDTERFLLRVSASRAPVFGADRAGSQ